MASYVPPLHVPLEPKWKHWPTYIYDMNYNYGMNYYQPMIDYIDRQGRSSSVPRDYRFGKRSELPELPWSDGRLFWQDKPVETYTRRELIQHAIDAEDQAREHLSHFKRARETRSVHFLGAVRLDDCLTFSVSKSGPTEEAVLLFE